MRLKPTLMHVSRRAISKPPCRFLKTEFMLAVGSIEVSFSVSLPMNGSA